jgi:Co/Zn/Cd efflux system component
MSGCCENVCASKALQGKQRGTLRAVLAINAIMFVVIVIASQISKSSALLADSLDNLGDAMTYGLSLMVVASTTSAKAKVALFKGLLILAAAVIVTSQIIHTIIFPSIPVFELMGGFSLLALAANSVCLLLLWRHRNDDINMNSVWECSRNDIAANLSVFIAAGFVWLASSGWPDIVVACGLVILLLRSSVRVITSSLSELKRSTKPANSSR